MGSQPPLWSIVGQAWGWPPVSMTYQQDVEDLARHEQTALLGYVYIDPPAKQGADAEISWWVVDAHVGTGLERDVDAVVPQRTIPPLVRWVGLTAGQVPAYRDAVRKQRMSTGIGQTCMGDAKKSA